MAALHNFTAEQFGFDADNYIGSTPQPNPWTADGFEFYARHRFTFQAELATQRGLLSPQEASLAADLAARLPDLVPAQPASLLHGDLWSGNQIADSQGHPAIIDPAAYYGWAEADLAMMVLFGSPGSGFWEAYNEVRPLEPGTRSGLGCIISIICSTTSTSSGAAITGRWSASCAAMLSAESGVHMDSGFGYVGVMEFIFIFAIVILVVGPRRILRGWRVIQDWVRNGFRRAGKTDAARKGRKIMRGLGSMAAYFARDRKNEE